MIFPGTQGTQSSLHMLSYLCRVSHSMARVFSTQKKGNQSTGSRAAAATHPPSGASCLGLHPGFPTYCVTQTCHLVLLQGPHS